MITRTHMLDRKPGWILAGLIWLWAGVATAGPTITLQDQVEVTSPRVHLGAVARIEGLSRAARVKVAQLDLGPAPRPGLSRVLSKAYLKTRLAGHTAGARLRLPERLVITRGTRTVRASGVEATIKAQIEEAMPHPSAEVAEIRVAHLTDATVPGGTTTRVVLPEGSDFVGLVPVRVEHYAGEGQIRTQHVEAYVDLYVDAWQAGVPLRVGAEITEDMIRQVRVPQSSLPHGYVEDPQTLIGARVIAQMAPGDVFRTSTVKPAPLVRRGDRVRLVVRHGGLMVAAWGEMLSYEGALGAQVQARNLSSNTLVYGRVAGPGELLVGGR